METVDISITQEIRKKAFGNEISSVLDIEKNLTNIIEKNSEHIIEKKTGETKRIIIDSYLTDKIFNFFGKNTTNKTKTIVKDIIKKTFVLKNKDVILFSKGSIYIVIILSSNDKRFNGFDKENISFVIHNFLKDFDQNNILYNVIKNLDINNYSKEELKDFIENNLNKVILNEYIIVIQNLLTEFKEEIDIKIIKGIAGKLFRDNYDIVLEELAKYFINNILNSKTIGELTINSIISQLDFTNKNIDFFEFNNKIENKIIKKINNITKKQLEDKIGTGITDFFIKMIIKNINIKQITNEIFNKISNKIIYTIENNFKDYSIIKNIEAFLSYYSGKTVIKNNGKKNYRFKYPELGIEGLNKSKDYINNINTNYYKFILNKLIEITKNKKNIEDKIKYIQKELEKEKIEASEKIVNIIKYQNKIVNLEEEINNKRNKIKKNKQNTQTLENKLLKLNNGKLIQLMLGKKEKIVNRIKELKNITKDYNNEIFQLNNKVNSFKQDLKYLEQQKKIIKNLNIQIEELENKLNIYTNKLQLIKKSMSNELKKRKIKI